MIKHVVMWKLKDEAEGCTKEENIKKIKELLMPLKDIIDEVKYMEVGANINPSEAAYDAVLITEFENENDLAVYQNHPEHLKVRKFITAVRTARTVVDFNF